MKQGMLAAVLAILAALATAGETVEYEGGEVVRPRLVILNPKSDFDGGDLGGRIGYSLRSKLRRSGRFEMPEELDFEDLDARGTARPGPGDIPAARAAAEAFYPHILAWGEVAQDNGYVIRLSAMDLAGDGELVEMEKRADGFRQVALICAELADELAEALTGKGYREVYPSKSTEGWARVGENLVTNGDFEEGKGSPDGWETVDGLCSFWESEEGHGRYIRMDSDVELAQWKEWKERLRLGVPASEAPEKTPTKPPKYDTVAGTYGVHLYSDPVPVKPGATYSIEFDARGLMSGVLFFPKVFVKAYGDEGVSLELYRMYKAVKPSKPDRWEHFS
ncbi:MAG: hypothetical protein ACYTAN_17290, partial [Planctomycetota bacterium]